LAGKGDGDERRAVTLHAEVHVHAHELVNSARQVAGEHGLKLLDGPERLLERRLGVRAFLYQLREGAELRAVRTTVEEQQAMHERPGLRVEGEHPLVVIEYLGRPRHGYELPEGERPISLQALQVIRDHSADLHGVIADQRIAQHAGEPSREPDREIVIEAGVEHEADVGKVGAAVRVHRRRRVCLNAQVGANRDVMTIWAAHPDAAGTDVFLPAPILRRQGAHASLIFHGEHQHRFAEIDPRPRADQGDRAPNLFELPGQCSRLALTGVRQHGEMRRVQSPPLRLGRCTLRRRDNEQKAYERSGHPSGLAHLFAPQGRGAGPTPKLRVDHFDS
jgi:hypothetical protein